MAGLSLKRMTQQARRRSRCGGGRGSPSACRSGRVRCFDQSVRPVAAAGSVAAGAGIVASGVSVSTDSESAVPAFPAGASAPTARTENEGPAAPSRNTSMAETVSSGGLRFGEPLCAAAEKSGPVLTIDIGSLTRASSWCCFA